MSLQLRIEALNATNTPHFSNPGTNVSNLQLNPDGTVRNLNGFGVITSTNRLGRQYDEREWRLGCETGVLAAELRVFVLNVAPGQCDSGRMSQGATWLHRRRRHATINATEECS